VTLIDRCASFWSEDKDCDHTDSLDNLRLQYAPVLTEVRKLAKEWDASE
jgi:hypothetical protein